MTYLYTLDSHDCFGPFASAQSAHVWARKTNKTSYQLLDKPPFSTTVVLTPHNPIKLDLDLVESIDGDLGLESLPRKTLVEFARELGINEMGSRGLIAARLRRMYQETGVVQ